MREHDHAILGEMHICLDAMYSSLNGSPKGTHRILGMLSFVSSVRNRLW